MRWLILSLGLWASLALADERSNGDVEAWNAGVDCYLQGDTTNALRLLRPLVLSRSHGARAAEVVAKLAYDAKDYEEAARMAQIALRAHPQDRRANENYTRAADRLPEMRERARREAIMKSAQGKDPGAMLLEATHSARKLLVEAGCYRTNAAPRAVALADQLSAAAQRLADVWLPVGETIAQAVTNQEQAATILMQLDQAEKKSVKAARLLGDLDHEAYAAMCDVEHDLTRFLKLTILPPAAMAEDLMAQSNAWQDVEAFNGREWQSDALDYTRAFRARFPAWARAYEQQAQSDTNRPPFTAEDQAKVSALATELEKLQLECCEKLLPPKQKEALAKIRMIQELLPKDQSQNQSNQQNPQNQQNQQNQPNKQDQQKNQQDQQNPADQSQPRDEPQGQDKQPEQSPSEPQSPPETPEDREVESLLQKAQERNDEHEAEKKARLRKSGLPPNEKDW